MDAVLETDTVLGDDGTLVGLRRRIDLQTEQLTRHARELGRLRADLERVNDRFDTAESASANA